MACQITNNSSLDMKGFEDIIQSLVSFSQKRFGFDNPPDLFLNSDPMNAKKMLGKTAFYDPHSKEIHIYVDGRHPKDIMRSIAHELIHHVQNLRGDLDGDHYHGEGYAQKDQHMRNMEKEAYLEGNMLLRDFEDRKEQTIYKEWRINKMSLKEWKNKELFTLLSDRWGFGKNIVAESDDKEITHMCALKVTHKESGQVGHPYKHTLTESGDISHYSVEFDDVLVENIAVEDLDIMVQKEHMHAKKDEKPHAKDKPVVSEEELEEMHCPSGKKDDELEEGLENPEKADLDKDGKLSSYEKKRGAAIEKSIKDQKSMDEELDEMHCPSKSKKDDEKLKESMRKRFARLIK